MANGLYSNPWNDERDRRLKELVQRQFSYAQITIMLNHEFHIGITRNSAIGRGARIGVEKSRKVVTKPVREKSQKLFKPPPPAPVFKCVPLEPSASASAPLHVSLVELADGACKYPFGSGPFTFCGQPVQGSYVYCRSHFALTHQGAESSRHTK